LRTDSPGTVTEGLNAEKLDATTVPIDGGLSNSSHEVRHDEIVLGVMIAVSTASDAVPSMWSRPSLDFDAELKKETTKRRLAQVALNYCLQQYPDVC